MSIVIAELSGRARITGTWPLLTGSASLENDAADGRELRGDASIVSIIEDIRPRIVRRQIVAPFRVYLGATEIPGWQLLPGTFYEEGESGTTFGFSMPLHSSTNPPGKFIESLGSPMGWLGPPGGKGAVRIDAILLTASGPRTIRLVTNGLFDNSSSAITPGGDTRTFNGIDAGGRYDRQLVTLTFPPGHGQTRGAVARRILQAIGVPAGSIAMPPTGRMYKGLQAIDRPGLALAQELLAVDLLELYRDRDGIFRARTIGFNESARTELVFRSEDLLLGIGNLGESSTSEGPTSVTLTGSAQVVREECGRKTVSQTVESYAVYAPVVTLKAQAPGVLGTITSTGLTQGAASLILVSRVVRDTEFDCETVMSERIRTYGWYNPTVWRYRLDTTGAIDEYNGGYINEAGAVTDDSFELRQWSTERFVLLSDVTTRHEYDERGFLTRSVTDSDGYVRRLRALKTRVAPSDDWETEPFVATLLIAGSGDGLVVPAGEYFAAGFGGGAVKTRETVSYDVTDDGYVQRQATSFEEWTMRPGTSALYNGAFESADSQQQFLVSRVEETVYGANTEGSHSEVTTTRDVSGRVTSVVVKSAEDGHLPSAARRTDLDPDPSIYDDDSEAAFAASASRYENQPIKVRVDADALLAVREAAEDKSNSEWAETPEELEQLAIHAIREGAKLQVQFALPFNPVIRRGHRVQLIVEALRWNYDVFVRTVRHQEDPTMTWTQVSGDVYLV